MRNEPCYCGDPWCGECYPSNMTARHVLREFKDRGDACVVFVDADGDTWSVHHDAVMCLAKNGAVHWTHAEFAHSGNDFGPFRLASNT